MNGFWSRRPSPAMVVAVIALLVALGGTGYAAYKLPKNSVGTKQLKKNAVNSAKVKNHSLTGLDINLAKLGTVPAANNAAHATTADSANSIPPAEPSHVVGASGEPPFLSGSANRTFPVAGASYQPVGFFKDHEGIVHLEGVADAGKEGSTPGMIFILPPGYRPANSKVLAFEPAEERGILISGVGVNLGGIDLSGGVYAPETEAGSIPLNGITFRAQG
jgi:hypothetical protein